jgi:hypothetical protein
MIVQPFSTLEAILVCVVVVLLPYMALIGVSRISKVLHEKWPSFPTLLDGL